MHIHWHFLKGSLTVPGSHIAHKTDFLEKSALFVAVSTCMFKGAFNYFACRQWVRNRGRPVVCKKVPRSQNAFPPRTAKPPLFLSRCWVDDIGTQVPGTGLRAWEGRIVLGVLLWRLTCALPRVPAGTREHCFSWVILPPQRTFSRGPQASPLGRESSQQEGWSNSHIAGLLSLAAFPSRLFHATEIFQCINHIALKCNSMAVQTSLGVCVCDQKGKLAQQLDCLQINLT